MIRGISLLTGGGVTPGRGGAVPSPPFGGLVRAFGGGVELPPKKRKPNTSTAIPPSAIAAIVLLRSAGDLPSNNAIEVAASVPGSAASEPWALPVVPGENMPQGKAASLQSSSSSTRPQRLTRPRPAQPHSWTVPAERC